MGEDSDSGIVKISSTNCFWNFNKFLKFYKK